MAALLNYFLDMLCGDNTSSRDIDNPGEMNYKPDELLGNIVLIYVYLGIN